MRTAAWVLLSGAAHAALVLVLPLASRGATERRPSVDNALVFELAVLPSEPPTPPPPTLATPRDPMPAPSPRIPVDRVRVQPRRVASAPSALEPPAIEPAAVEPPTKAAPHLPSERLAVSLSPRLAALSMIELYSEDAGVDARTVGPVRGAATRKLESALTDALRRVDIRHEPVLKPKSGGGYVYHGNGFQATIATDGSVEMEDKFVQARWIFKPTMGVDGELAGFRIFELRYDIFAWLDRKLGNDPFRSERRWFLDHTRGLREDMAAHFHDKRHHSLAE